MADEKMDFECLVRQIQEMHNNLLKKTTKAVNFGLTCRNWLIGMYIAEYQLNGIDRAEYGEQLISDLAKKLSELSVSNCNRRQLYRYLAFYQMYPQIVGTTSPQLQVPPKKLTENLSYSHLELAANLFRATQTEEKLRRENVQGKNEANQTHFEVGSKVRKTIQELGGTMPEDLPAPDKSIKQLEDEQKKLTEPEN